MQIQVTQYMQAFQPNSFLCAILRSTTGLYIFTPLSVTWGWYHRDRRPSSDDSPTVIPPLALDKPSIMKRYHCWQTCSHTSPRRSPTMVTLHDTWFVECLWWYDGWTVKTVVTWQSSAPMILVPELWLEVTRSAENKSCWFHSLVYFLTDQNGIWCGFETHSSWPSWYYIYVRVV